MIDLHTHFLPGIDDGAKDVGESIGMLKAAAEQGVRICVATPHAVIHNEGDIDRFLARRESARAAVAAMAAQTLLEPVHMIMGAEVYLDNDINRYDGIGRLCIENTDAMLIEFPRDRGFDIKTEDRLYELSRGGITPVIAHIDRYPFAYDALSALRGIDAVYQVNASALATLGGRRLVRRLEQMNAEIVFASDMHNTSDRACNMLAAYKRASKRYGHERATAMFSGNAAALLSIG